MKALCYVCATELVILACHAQCPNCGAVIGCEEGMPLPETPSTPLDDLKLALNHSDVDAYDRLAAYIKEKGNVYTGEEDE